MNIKILVATHKSYWMPDDDVYLPIHVGKAGQKDIGFIGDDTGENISYKNANYCELTGMYWAWKNLQADYIGLCHYRRYFTNSNPRNCEKKKQTILSRSDWEGLLVEHPIIVPDKRKYYIETIRSHYNHSYHAKDLDMAEVIVKEKYPQYVVCFDDVMKRTWAHMFNMFVMRRDYFSDYCQWLFDVLQELENRTDISKYNAADARVYGYISELLLDVWLEANNLEVYEQNVAFLEPQNWLKKGGLFLKRKFLGN